MGIVSIDDFGADPVTITGPALDNKVNPLVTEFNGSIDNDNIKAAAGIVYSKLNLTASVVYADLSSTALSAVTQTLAMSGKAINFAKGSDIASATTTDIGAMVGNYGDVTGTTTITGLGTVQAGTFRMVRFTGALTLTHNGTSLLLPTAANITTVANDVAGFVSLGSGNWKCLWYQRYDGTPLVSGYTPSKTNALSGSVIQTVRTVATTYRSLGTTAIPDDDSTPLWDEGNTHADLDTAIAVTSTSNPIKATISFDVAHNGAASFICVAMYLDPTGSSASTKAGSVYMNDSNPGKFTAVWWLTAADTSSHTYKFRIGNAAGSAVYLNGDSSGRIYGGAGQSTVTLEEIKA